MRHSTYVELHDKIWFIKVPEIPYDDRVVLKHIQQFFDLGFCELAQCCTTRKTLEGHDQHMDTK
jgi:hypothetical protein